MTMNRMIKAILIVMMSSVGWLGGCAAETADLDTSESMSELQFMNWTITCPSGWPGTRGCTATFTAPTDIVPGIDPLVTIVSGNGNVGVPVASVARPRTVNFNATIAEGDAFNPGKSTTVYSVVVLVN